MALENLPNLKTFEFCRSVQILAEIRRENLLLLCFKTYSITEFQCTEFQDDSGNIVPYEMESLRLAAALCPSVNVVHITLQPGLTDFELDGLLGLKTLRELKIEDQFVTVPENEPPQWKINEITFDGGVLPLLKAFGSLLVRLTLSKLNISVNICAILELCPKLEHLYIRAMASYSMVSLDEETRHQDVGLKHLKQLELGSRDTDLTDFFPEMFSFILSSPELTSLRFYYCFTLTDEFLEEAALLDRFPNLQCLEFYRCDSVTKEGIDSILNGRIPLKRLFVSWCHMIRGKEFLEGEAKARQENWEIEFEFEGIRESEVEAEALDEDEAEASDEDEAEVWGEALRALLAQAQALLDEEELDVEF